LRRRGTVGEQDDDVLRSSRGASVVGRMMGCVIGSMASCMMRRVIGPMMSCMVCGVIRCVM
jgi:hypothetical protein